MSTFPSRAFRQAVLTLPTVPLCFVLSSSANSSNRVREQLRLNPIVSTLGESRAYYDLMHQHGNLMYLPHKGGLSR